MLYAEITLPETGKKVKSGWLPPMPDLRDYTEETPVIENMLEEMNFKIDRRAKKIDLRYPFSIPRQQDLHCPPASPAAQLLI